ncbi:uncharacterized protein BO80DRAFT_82816 [Aspergillus ibericus CBS 121593]|uniref:Transmembrane protein n=1 Tax=Aspergillus ibericus CBS 121593 TaxID=1448316 RepID=A0A395HDE0_9EURO|nr:hypothetical protein BO80DRAFT_82816 [Aspergillus ibericus CBS 121593]RAL05852.1 hypothetical protein BO80DRAFT_82816 [Aspergillus ibericus CBS 121593]
MQTGSNNKNEQKRCKKNFPQNSVITHVKEVACATPAMPPPSSSLPIHPAPYLVSSFLRIFQLAIAANIHHFLFFALLSRWNRRRLGPLWSLVRE